MYLRHEWMGCNSDGGALCCSGGQAHDGRERHGESRSQETATFRTPKGDRPPRARNGGARVFPSPAGDAPAVPTPRSHLGLSGAAGRAEIEAAPLPGPATGHAQPWTPGAPSTLLGWRSGLGGWGRPGLWFPTPNGTLHTDVSGMSRFGAGLLPGTPGGRPGTGDLGTSATAPFVSGVGEVRSGAVADAALLGMAVFGRDDDGSGDDDDKNRGRKKARNAVTMQYDMTVVCRCPAAALRHSLLSQGSCVSWCMRLRCPCVTVSLVPYLHRR